MRNATRLTLAVLVLCGLSATGCNLTTLLSNPGGGGSGSTGDGSNTSSLSISGRIVAPQSAKKRPHAQATDNGYTVAAQSVETQEIYSAETDENGDFELPIPDEEQGHAFYVVILDPNGHPLGPVVLDEGQGEGHVAVNLDQDLSLGQMALPGDPNAGPIQPGQGFDGQNLVADDVTARVNSAGVPVGVPTLGKGPDAMGDSSDDPRFVLDMDRDGLPDFIDADNDGDGTVDDFDDDADDDAGRKEGFRLNFFMNLKISEDHAGIYYSGSTADRRAALAEDTVITFEVVEEAGHTPAISSVTLLPHPGPPYIPLMTVQSSGALWSDSSYAFTDAGDRFEAFIVPHARINAGDTIAIRIDFDDGTHQVCWSMINYVFTNIPQLVRYGASGALVDYTAGSGIEFDGSKDLVLEFRPPMDETGAYLTGFDYTFQIFYNDSGNNQLSVDGSATWSSALSGFDTSRQAYTVPAADLGTLSSDNTYTVTLPKEIFPNSITLTDGSTTAVNSYKIDITAENNSNNAALMVTATKK